MPAFFESSHRGMTHKLLRQVVRAGHHLPRAGKVVDILNPSEFKSNTCDNKQYGNSIMTNAKTSIRTSYMNFLMPGTVLGTIIIIMVFVKERYLRKDHEDLKRKEERLLTPSAATNYNGGGSSEYIF